MRSWSAFAISIASYELTLTMDAIDLSIPLRFGGEQPNAFAAEMATATALGDTRSGASVNYERLTFVPHCNGTHTECVGHITDERLSIMECLRDVLIPAVLISLELEQADGGAIISQSSIRAALATADIGMAGIEALIVRTLPNDDSKLRRRYDMADPPPYFAADAMTHIADIGIRHLLVDLPSIDRLDDPSLPAHRSFWRVRAGSRDLDPATRRDATITEMIYVPNDVKDGDHLLNLQIAPFVSDAAPSRPMLLPRQPR